MIYDSALRELFRLRSLEGPLTRPIRASLVLLAAAPSCLFARIPQTSSSIAIEAVLVNPNGMLGTAYMVAIKPFRYLLVYPSMLREIGHQWEQARTASPEEASA